MIPMVSNLTDAATGEYRTEICLSELHGTKVVAQGGPEGDQREVRHDDVRHLFLDIPCTREARMDLARNLLTIVQKLTFDHKVKS